MRALTAVACLLLFSASACGNDTSSIVVTADDTGAEIVVSTGDRIEARLESNPTTGYSWQLNSQTVDAFTSIEPVEYEAPSDDGRVGIAGTEVFAIDIVDTGAGVLRFEYLRPFDNPPVPERVVEYIIRADGAPWPLDSIGSLPPIASDSAPARVEIADLPTGGDPRNVVVSGFVIWDEERAQLCEQLLESAPPQCGGAAITILDPDRLSLKMAELNGVRWTNNRVELTGQFDGTGLMVGP